jgi:hypothetical protein
MWRGTIFILPPPTTPVKKKKDLEEIRYMKGVL